MKYSIFTDEELMSLLKLIHEKRSQAIRKGLPESDLKDAELDLALYMNLERGYALKIRWGQVIIEE